MLKKKILFSLLAFSSFSFVHAQEHATSEVPLITKDNQSISADVAESSNASLNLSKEIFGTDPSKVFTFYRPNYFVIGKDDLKLQFSSKYRIASSYNFYLAYTQLMFWHIYDESMPFEEINYQPEIFYRLKEDKTKFIKSLDLGVIHNSNGKDNEVSRSINSAFIKANAIIEFGILNIISELKVFYTFSKDKYSKQSITEHTGYWEYKGTITHVITHDKAHLDLEFQFNSGKKFYNVGKGSRELGLIYNFESKSFNPNIYLQYFSGYGENLLHQNKKKDAVRLGLMLAI